MTEPIPELHLSRFSEIWHQVFHFLNQPGATAFSGKLEGVSTLEVGIINVLSQNPQLIIKEINERLNVPPSTLTCAIGRLEKRGFVKRVITQKDLRSFGLELTEEGKLAQEEHLAQEKILFQKILASLENDSEREMFITLLNKVVDYLTADYYQNNK